MEFSVLEFALMIVQNKGDIVWNHIKESGGLIAINPLFSTLLEEFIKTLCGVMDTLEIMSFYFGFFLLFFLLTIDSLMYLK